MRNTFTQAFLVVLLSLFIYQSSVAQAYSWAVKAFGKGFSEGRAITSDASGNTYVVGNFREVAIFWDTSPGQLFRAVGESDVFVGKLDAEGQPVWVTQLGGAGFDIGYAIASDEVGNVYVTGSFSDTVHFAQASGIPPLVAKGRSDIFLAKFNSEGQPVWAKQLGGVGNDVGKSVSLDAAGQIYLAGSFERTIDFTLEKGTTSLTASGTDIFISKLDTNGNYLWTKHLGGRNLEVLTLKEITADDIGQVYLIGEFQGTVYLNPNTEEEALPLTALGGTDIFVGKIATNGEYEWIKSFGSTQEDRGSGITLNQAGQLYITGKFSGTIDFNSSEKTHELTATSTFDIFVGKLDKKGNFLWAKQFNGTKEKDNFSDVPSFYFTSEAYLRTLLGADNWSSDQPFKMVRSNESLGITSDSKGNIYLVGNFEKTVDFDPGEGTAPLTAAGALDIFICKLDTDGKYQWAKQVGAKNAEEGGHSITLDAANNLYFTGYLSGGIVDFDPNESTNTLEAIGGTDMFVCKWKTTTSKR